MPFFHHVKSRVQISPPLSLTFPSCARYQNSGQVIRACDRFNGRVPVKGMPPGVYAEIPNDVSPASGRALPQQRGAVLRVFLLVVVAMAVAAAVVAKVVQRRYKLRLKVASVGIKGTFVPENYPLPSRG